MAVDKIFRPYGFQIHTDDFDPLTTIAGLTDYSVNDAPNVNQEFTDGSQRPTRVSKRGSEESITATSVNIVIVNGESGEIEKLREEVAELRAEVAALRNLLPTAQIVELKDQRK